MAGCFQGIWLPTCLMRTPAAENMMLMLFGSVHVFVRICSVTKSVCIQALTEDRPHAATLKHHRSCNVWAVIVNLWELGSPVQHLASHEVDAERCSHFFSFFFSVCGKHHSWCTGGGECVTRLGNVGKSAEGAPLGQGCQPESTKVSQETASF